MHSIINDPDSGHCPLLLKLLRAKEELAGVPHFVRRSLSYSTANTKQPPCCAWFFCFFVNLMKASFQRFSQSKNPLAGVVVFCLIVELAGVEPASKHGDHMLSTCLVLLDFRDISAAEQPKMSLVPVCFAVRSELSSG
jgi:hypothetical protein